MKVDKKVSFRILLALELLLIVIGIIGLFGKNTVYQYGPEDMTVNFGEYDVETGGYYLEPGMVQQEENVIDFNGIQLPKGTYAVSLHYATDANMSSRCFITDDTLGEKVVQSNGEHLYAETSETDFSLWLHADTSQMIVHISYAGEGSLLVTGLTITRTNASGRIFLFWVIAGSLLANGIYCYVKACKQKRISQKDRNVHFGLLVTLLFASLPLMIDSIMGSGDIVYHLMRIEGIKDGLLSGQFPVRIAPQWQQGYGYASSIFYGETLLYIAALFRLIGFTAINSYRLFLLLLNVAVILVSYRCFTGIFQEKYIGLLCSALYSLSIYRIYKTYMTGSFGEAFGVLFLPLLAYGFYRVFTEDIQRKEYKWCWIPLTIGYTGLVQSHLLTGELAGAFTILLCVLLWKKVFRLQTFLVLAKTVIYSILLSAWFLVPFADYMLTGDFVIQNVSTRTIQSRGLYVAHLLLANPVTGSNVFFENMGMYDSAPTSIGIVLIAGLVIWLLLLFFRKTAALGREEREGGKIAALCAILAMVMSLSVFPWDRIQFLNGVTQMLVSSIQFPNRFLTIATVALTFVAGVAAKCIQKEWKEKGPAIYFTGMMVLLLIGNVYLLNDMVYRLGPIALYNEEGMGTGNIAGAEYLPYGADASQYGHRAPVVEEGLEVSDYTKTWLQMEIACENTADRERALELPLLYYKGYHAWDQESGEELPVYVGSNFVVGVAVPVGYQGTVCVDFASPWYWRCAETLSFATFLILAAACIRRSGRHG